jgi:hypothetical protein
MVSAYRIPRMAGQPYTPSNGSEGDLFIAAFCKRCKLAAAFPHIRDGDCMIVIVALLGGSPAEWTHDAGGCPTCTAFEPVKP